VGTPVANGGNANTTSNLSCTGTKQVLSGGASVSNPTIQLISQSYPTSNTNWTISVENTTGTNRTFTVYVICASV
jgi:hypothetical protein